MKKNQPFNLRFLIACMVTLIGFAINSSAQTVSSNYLQKSQIIPGTLLPIRMAPPSPVEGLYVRHNQHVSLNYTMDALTDVYDAVPWRYEVIVKIMDALDSTRTFNDTLAIEHNDSTPTYRSGMYYDLPWSSFRIRIVSVCGTVGNTPGCVTNPETYPLLPADIELEISVIQNQIESFTGFTSSGNDEPYNQDSVMVDCKEEYLDKRVAITEQYNAIRAQKLGEVAVQIGYTPAQMAAINTEIWNRRQLMIEAFVDTLIHADTTYLRACTGSAALLDTGNINQWTRYTRTLFKNEITDVIREGELYLVSEFDSLPELRAEYEQGVLNVILSTIGDRLENIMGQISQTDTGWGGCYIDGYESNISIWLPWLENLRNDYIQAIHSVNGYPNFNDSLYWAYKSGYVGVLRQTDDEYADALHNLGEYMYLRCGYGGSYYAGCETFYNDQHNQLYTEERNIQQTIKEEISATYGITANHQDALYFFSGYSSQVFYSTNPTRLRRDSVNTHGWAGSCVGYYSRDFYTVTGTIGWLDWFLFNMPNEVMENRRNKMRDIYSVTHVMPDSVWWGNYTDSLINIYTAKAPDEVDRRLDSLLDILPAYSACFDSTGNALIPFYTSYIEELLTKVFYHADSIFSAGGASFYRRETAFIQYDQTYFNDPRLLSLYQRRDSIQQEQSKRCISGNFKGFPTISYFSCYREKWQSIQHAKDRRDSLITVLGEPTSGGISLPAGWDVYDAQLTSMVAPFIDELNYRLDSVMWDFTEPCIGDSLEFVLFRAALSLDPATEALIKQQYLTLPLDSFYFSWIGKQDSVDEFYTNLLNIHINYVIARNNEVFHQRLPLLLSARGINPDSCITDSLMLAGESIFGSLVGEASTRIDQMLGHISYETGLDITQVRFRMMYYTVKLAGIEYDYQKAVNYYLDAINEDCKSLEIDTSPPDESDPGRHNAQVLACQNSVTEKSEAMQMRLYMAMVQHVSNAFGADAGSMMDNVFDHWIGHYFNMDGLSSHLISLDSAWSECPVDTNYQKEETPILNMVDYMQAINGYGFPLASQYYLSPDVPKYTNNGSPQRTVDSLFNVGVVAQHMEKVYQFLRGSAINQGVTDSCLIGPIDSTRRAGYMVAVKQHIEFFEHRADEMVAMYPSIDADTLKMKLFWIQRVLQSELAVVAEEFMRYTAEYAACGETIEPTFELFSIEQGDGGTIDTGPKLTPVASRLPGNVIFLTPMNPTVFNRFGPKVQVMTETGPCGTTKYVKWDHVAGAVEYDLEWVYIDNWVYVNGVMANNSANIQYRAFAISEPTRVTVKGNRFPFPGEYPDGKLYFRVRGVSRVADNTYNSYEQPQFLPWGYNWQGYNVTAADVNFVGTNPFNNTFENNLNWQWECSFAEEGKFKRVIGYYDGLNRSRQTVSHMSTDNLSVIGETLYDHEGRAAVQVLPYPEPCYELSYRNHTREDHEGLAFDKEDFELDSGTKTLKNSVGASEYYSVLNPFMAVENPLMHMGSIPDANLYPYSQTTFMRDNTGRPATAGGVGSDHRIGSGKETRYFYGNASETELRRLFGKNVGVALHYKKNLVMDANGQLSAAYVDQEGRTIATALAGVPPENLLELDSYNPELFMQNITANNKFDAVNHAWTITYRHPNELAGNEAAFSYDYGSDQLLSTTIQGLNGVCLLCEFDLQISVTDPDGNLVALSDISGAGLSGSAQEINVHIDNGVYQFADPCSTQACQNCNISFKAKMLAVGTYTIYKKLVWDQQAAFDAIKAALDPSVNTYTADYLDNLIETHISQIDSTDCDLLVEGGMGSIPADDGGVVDSSAMQTECRAMLMQMINQVTPWMGQGDPPIPTSGLHYNSDFLTYLNDNRPTPADYDPSHVPAQINPAIIPNDISLWDILVALQNGSCSFEWKEELAKGHPEYCWYQKCMDYSVSAKYITDMAAIADLTQGYAYRDPQNRYGVLQPFTGLGSAPELHDPLNLNEIHNKTQDSGPNGESIWELASLVYNNYNPTVDASKAAWQTFRSGYLQARTDAFYTETEGCPFLKDAGDEIPATAVVKPPLDVDGIIDEATGYANIWNAGSPASPMCEDICEENVRVWISQLYINCGEPFINTSGVFVENVNDMDMQIIKTRLGLYCKGRCGPENPYAIITQQMLDDAMDASPGEEGYYLRLAIEYFNENVAGGACEAIQVNDDGHWEATFVHAEGEYTTQECRILDVNLSSAVTVKSVVNKLNEGFLARTSVNDNFHALPEVNTPSGYGIFFSQEPFLVSTPYPTAAYDKHCVSMGITPCESMVLSRMAPPKCSECSVSFYDSNNQPANAPSIQKILSADYTNITHHPGGNVTVPVTYQIAGLPRAGNIYFNLTGCCRDTVCAILPVPWETTIGDSSQTVDCIQTMVQQATEAAHNEFDIWLENQIFEALQYAHCKITENLSYTYTKAEHHYTLYYYDQAGNLVQTVPPEGVHPLDATAFTAAGQWNGISNPPHDMESRYKFNSLQVAIESETPDGGFTHYKPDLLGRPNESRNAEQRKQAALLTAGSTVVDIFSKTEYDNLGRINRVFEQKNTTVGGNTAIARSQITETVYDESVSIGALGWQATHTRSRVASVRYRETESGNIRHAYHYSYDIHGNVKSFVTDVPALAGFATDQRYRITDYYYDLISGKVNQVHYQRGKLDQFFWRYNYDADNRLLLAESSRDYLYWERDAKYFYYPHGPLKRVETGQRKVQGTDYFYTIHGWLKGVNAGALNETYDVGRDGDIALSPNPNKMVARDAFGFTLDYYNGDYSAIGGGNMNQIPEISGSNFQTAVRESGLYNGNIVRMATALRKPDETRMDVLGNAYQYDQLNRIRSNRSFVTNDLHTTNNWGGIAQSTAWNGDYTYDANGNIMSLARHDDQGVLTDNFTDYHYLSQTGLPNQNYVGKQNRLWYITDTEPIMGMGTQSSNNYVYDGIGNLTKDAAEEIAEIKWTVYGKVSKVIRRAASKKPDLDFFYDASGQRYLKVVKPKNTNGTLKPQLEWTMTYYQRDAQGNILAIYDIKDDDGKCGYDLYLSNHILYGSARLGTTDYKKTVKLGSQHTRAFEYYRTSNHAYLCLLEAEVVKEDDRIIGILPGDPVIGVTGGVLTALKTVDVTAGVASIKKPIFEVAAHYPGKIPAKYPISYKPGMKRYEFSNHLGNVLVTVGDKPKGISINNNGIVDYYLPNVLTANDYEPFGAPLKGRVYEGEAQCSTVTVPDTTFLLKEPFNTMDLATWALDGATSTMSSGVVTVNCTAANQGLSGLLTGVEPSKTYTIKVKLDQVPALGVNISIRDYSTGSLVLVWNADIYSAGVHTLTFTTNSGANSNVRVKIQTKSGGNTTFKVDDIRVYFAQLLSHTECESADAYRFGFNGMEKVDEVYGDANAYDFGARVYDPRIGKFLSIDPRTKQYPFSTPYSFAINNPISLIDEKGEGPIYPLLYWMAKQINGTVAVEYGADVQAAVFASWARGMAVDKYGNVAIYTSQTGVMNGMQGSGALNASVGVGLSLTEYANSGDASVAMGSGSSYGVDLSTHTIIEPLGLGLNAKSVLDETNKVVGTSFGGSIGLGAVPVGVSGGKSTTQGVLMSGDEYQRYDEVMSGAFDKVYREYSVHNRELMNNGIGIWTPIPGSTRMDFVETETAGVYEGIINVTLDFKPMASPGVSQSAQPPITVGVRTGIFFKADSDIGAMKSTGFKTKAN